MHELHQIVGRLGDDPEMRFLDDGRGVCNIRVATDVGYKKGDEFVKKTNWWRVSIWGNAAENASKYLSKGSVVLVEGRVSARVWEDRNGESQVSLEMMANNVRFLSGGSGKRDGESRKSGKGGGKAKTSNKRSRQDDFDFERRGDDDEDDDIPF